MSADAVPSIPLDVIDLDRISPREIEPLWARERELWREVLAWDISDGVDVIRRAMERRLLAGKAGRVGGEVVGYGYYLREGRRATLAGLMLLPEADGPMYGRPLVEALVASMRSEPGIRRIESQLVDFGQHLGSSWLRECLEGEGLRRHERLFLRRSVSATPPLAEAGASVRLEPWSDASLREASELMHRAHRGRSDAEANELYRTRQGCRTLLENILIQQGCGVTVREASCVARTLPGNVLSGFAIATEISPAHAHLAQIAIRPEAQGQGLGRLLLTCCLRALAAQTFRTVSLMVSEENERAVLLYRALGFETVLRFSVFSWNRERRGPRFR